MKNKTMGDGADLLIEQMIDEEERCWSANYESISLEPFDKESAKELFSKIQDLMNTAFTSKEVSSE